MLCVNVSYMRDLMNELNLIHVFEFTRSVREQSKQTIDRFFREKGFWYTDVEIIEELTDETTNRVELTFNIDPGERIKVREINFHGNEQFSDRKLRSEFDTIKQNRWWRSLK